MKLHLMSRDIIFRQNLVNLGRRIRLNFSINGSNFEKPALEGKMLFASLNYSKYIFKTATLGKFVTNLTKNNQIVFKGLELFGKLSLGFFIWAVGCFSLYIPFLWEECFHSICWLNTCISHKNRTTKAYIFGTKIIEIAFLYACVFARTLARGLTSSSYLMVNLVSLLSNCSLNTSSFLKLRHVFELAILLFLFALL